MSNDQYANVGMLTKDLDETPFKPNYKVEILAHSSPRWQNVSADEANRLNFDLSKRRGEAVKKIVEEIFTDKLGSLISLDIEEKLTQSGGAVGINTVPIGTIETLGEAKGNRHSNDPAMRRVNINVALNRRIKGAAGQCYKERRFKSSASKLWHVSVETVSGGSLGLAAQHLTLRLTNDLTGETMRAEVFTQGGGPKASLGTSQSIWSDPTGFKTDKPKTFSDFQGASVRYSTFDISLGLGYSWSRLSFIGFGKGAQGIDVGGASVGTASFGGSVTGSIFSSVNIERFPPPDGKFITVSGVRIRPYQRMEGQTFSHKVFFVTEDDVLTTAEKDNLHAFLNKILSY